MKQGQSQTRQKYAVYYGISCQYIYRLICSVPLSRDLFSARILWGGRTCYALWSNVGPGLLNCFCKCKTFLEEIDTAVFITVSFTVYESKVDTRLPWTSFVFGSQFFSAEVIHSSDKAFQLSEMQLMLPTLPFVFFSRFYHRTIRVSPISPPGTIRDRRWSELSQALRCRCQRPHQLQAAECHLAVECRKTSLAAFLQLCFCENGPILTPNQLFNHHITIYYHILPIQKLHFGGSLPFFPWQFPGFHPGLRNSSSLELHSGVRHQKGNNHKLGPMGPMGTGLSRVNPPMTRVVTHLLSGMSHQVWNKLIDFPKICFEWCFREYPTSAQPLFTFMSPLFDT